MVESARLRQRRRPEDAEREILTAAETLLAEGGDALITVGDVMSRTGLGRSSFYMYFRDVPDLMRRLLARIEGELFAVSAAFTPSDDPAEDCARLCAGIVGVHARHGPILRAVSRVLAREDNGLDFYRACAVEHFVGAASAWVDLEIARGRIAGPLPSGAVRALVLMSDVYLADTLGRVPAEDPRVVTETLAFLWRRALYGGGFPAAARTSPRAVAEDEARAAGVIPHARPETPSEATP